MAARLNTENARKDALTAERNKLVGMLSVADLAAEQIKADLRLKAQDIAGVLGKEIPQARQMLRKLLADKLTVEPVGKKGKKDRGYTFRGALTLDKLIAGEAFRGTRTEVVAPTGFEPVCCPHRAYSNSTRTESRVAMRLDPGRTSVWRYREDCES